VRTAARLLGVIGSTGLVVAAVVVIVILRQPAAPSLSFGSSASLQPADKSPNEPPIEAPTIGNPEPSVASVCTDGHTYLMTFDRVGESVEVQSAFATAVGLVRVVAISEGKANPPAVELSAHPSLFNRVYRIATLETVSLAKGDSKELQSVRLFGGKLGCDTWEVSGYPDLVVGRRYLVFAQRLPAPDGQAVAELTATSIWPVDPDGVVATPANGLMSIDEVIAIVRTASTP